MIRTNRDSEGGGRRLAWNGITFLHPRSWAPVTIDKTRLLLATDNGAPAMEIKWGTDGGSLEDQVDRLAAGLPGKKKKARFRRAQPPAAWLDAIGGRHAIGFSWSAEGTGGRGLAMACGNLNCLVQFFPQAGGRHARLVLASTAPQHDAPWRVFDIVFTPMEDAVLDSYRFQPGLFILRFSRRKTETETFARLAPADALLRRQDLAAWAKEVMGAFGNLSKEEGAGLRWRAEKRGCLPWLASRLRGRPRFFSGKIWEQKNRLLAIGAAAANPIEQERINRQRLMAE